MNGVVVVVGSCFLAVLLTLWALTSIPVLPSTHPFALAVVSNDAFVPLPVNQGSGVRPELALAHWSCGINGAGLNFTPDYMGLDFVAMPRGGSVSGSFSAPAGAPVLFEWWMTYGSEGICSTNETSGSFSGSVSTNLPVLAEFSVLSPYPLTVYVNGTDSYLEPLL